MFNSTGLSGNSFSPISLLDFTEPELPDDLLPWNAEQDLKQLESVGMEVDAVPFSVDPLKVVEHVKRKVGRHVRLGDLKVDLERDVNEILVSLGSRSSRRRPWRLILYLTHVLGIVCSISYLLSTIRFRVVVQAQRR